MLTILTQLKNKLSRLFNRIKDYFQPFAQILKVFIKSFIENMNENLKPWKPWFKRVSNGFSALSSFMSTLQASFKITPVIISAITVFTALPLFKMVFPTITISQPVITLMLITVAGIAAIRTYRDAIERDRLDKLIEENTRVIAVLSDKVSTLEAKLKPADQTAPTSKATSQGNIVPLFCTESERCKLKTRQEQNLTRQLRPRKQGR